MMSEKLCWFSTQRERKCFWKKTHKKINLIVLLIKKVKNVKIIEPLISHLSETIAENL